MISQRTLIIIVHVMTVIFVPVLIIGCHAQKNPRLTQLSMPVQNIDTVLNRYAPTLMVKNGVVGMYVGATIEGKPCLRVMVEVKTGELERTIPSIIEGYPVEIEEVGEIEPFEENANESKQ